MRQLYLLAWKTVTAFPLGYNWLDSHRNPCCLSRPAVPHIPRDLDSRTTITIGDQTFDIEADDLEAICVLGRGAYGVVEKMKHKQTNTILAVKVNPRRLEQLSCAHKCRFWFRHESRIRSRSSSFSSFKTHVLTLFPLKENHSDSEQR